MAFQNHLILRKAGYIGGRLVFQNHTWLHTAGYIQQKYWYLKNTHGCYIQQECLYFKPHIVTCSRIICTYSRKVGISNTYRFYTKQVVFNKIYGVLNRTLYIPQVVHSKRKYSDSNNTEVNAAGLYAQQECWHFKNKQFYIQQVV